MNTSKRNILLVWIVLGMFPVLCLSQDMVQDFYRGVEASTAKFEENWIRASYSDFEQAADRLVQRYTDASSIEFLKSKTQDRKSKRLALLTLAKIAVQNKDAENALYEEIQGRNPGAIAAIAYIEPQESLRMAETLLLNASSRSTRRSAARILVAYGDEESLGLLEEATVREPMKVNREKLEAAISELQHKLFEVPAEQQESWSRQEIVYWRNFADSGPAPRNYNAIYPAVAARMYRNGERFSREFLVYKLDLHDPLAFTIIAYQKDTWAIGKLEEYALREDPSGSFARSTLGSLGTREALDAVEKCLIPGGDEKINRSVINILQSRGDTTSADFLEEMSSNEDFSDRNRSRMQAARDYIRIRLSGRARMAK